MRARGILVSSRNAMLWYCDFFGPVWATRSVSAPRRAEFARAGDAAIEPTQLRDAWYTVLSMERRPTNWRARRRLLIVSMLPFVFMLLGWARSLGCSEVEVIFERLKTLTPALTPALSHKRRERLRG